MIPVKKIALMKSWQELVPAVEADSCILLKGANDHFILGWKPVHTLLFERDQTDLKEFEKFIQHHKGQFIFSFISYDVKNKIEPFLSSKNKDYLELPDSGLIVMEHVLEFQAETCLYYGDHSEDDLLQLFDQKSVHSDYNPSVELNPVTSKENYLERVKQIQKDIQYGSIYEMNYCVTHLGAARSLNSFSVFQKLNQLADAPFSVYLNVDEMVVISASPERYIKKEGNKLLSQPIKGTARRDADLETDKRIGIDLQNDPKERSENIMIVDLVRNDLSRVAVKSSVKVDELCGLYSFKTVHQLISTISCEIDSTLNFTDVLKATFPMGSMTGAPKISAMQLADQYEDFRRGIYSGTIGYINPLGDFDFNVVIRSILHNKHTGVVSCSVGGAITIHADPEKEYNECLLKLHALKQALC